MACGMGKNMRNCRIHVRNHLDCKDIIEKFGVEIGVGCRCSVNYLLRSFAKAKLDGNKSVVFPLIDNKFFELWQKENKPQGWEIHDARLGGLLQRLQTCKKRLQSYIVGEIDKIEELEEEILLIGDGINLSYNNYIHLISTNIL